MRINMRKATIKDVAKEAGVSIGTVSNALNDARYVNEATKKKVMDAVEKLNYIPNLNGRFLKAGSTKTLGFFTNSIAGPYFCSLLDAMCRQCERLGYHLVIFVTKDSTMVMSNIIGRGLDGVLIYEDTTMGEVEIKMLQKEGVKAVFLDREIAREGVGSVLFDSYRGGYEATRHLINLGHRNIGFIECVDEVIDSLRRKEGYRAAMNECGLPVKEELILPGAFDEEYTFNVISNYLNFGKNEMVDAFLAGNDSSAIGCIKALESKGYRVPDDVSIIGFDDIDIAQYYRPSLTTVRNPIKRQGILAIDMLVGMIAGTQDGTMQHLRGELIVRESCTIKK